MPYQYNFRNPNNQIIVQCNLECTQCRGITRAGNRCSRNTCIGVNYCWSHLMSVKHLKIKPSNLHGKGLFAYLHKEASPNDIVFRAGENVIIYDGKNVQSRQIHRVYGDFTAPYAVTFHGGDRMKDAACQRGIAAIANTHKNKKMQNARLLTTGERRRSIYLEATRDIYHGEEIINDYGYEYNLPQDENTSFTTRYVQTQNQRRN